MFEPSDLEFRTINQPPQLGDIKQQVESVEDKGKQLEKAESLLAQIAADTVNGDYKKEIDVIEVIEYLKEKKEILEDELEWKKAA